MNKITKQKGAALFISLMLLFLMTIIGLNALDTATSDERMALNSQQEQEVFHAADSAINLIKRNPNAVFDIVSAGPGGSSTPVVFNNQPNVVATAAGSYDGCDDPPPETGTEWAFHSSDISSTAQLANTGATATHTQRIARVGRREACPF